MGLFLQTIQRESVCMINAHVRWDNVYTTRDSNPLLDKQSGAFTRPDDKKKQSFVDFFGDLVFDLWLYFNTKQF